MIAIPIKFNKVDSAINTLFRKSKWFVFIDENGNINIERNEFKKGREVINSMLKKGVKKLIFNSMGANPFMLLQRNNIECFYSGSERILFEDAIKKLKNNELIRVDSSNMLDFIEKNHKIKDSKIKKDNFNVKI